MRTGQNALSAQPGDILERKGKQHAGKRYAVVTVQHWQAMTFVYVARVLPSGKLEQRTRILGGDPDAYTIVEAALPANGTEAFFQS